PAPVDHAVDRAAGRHHLLARRLRERRVREEVRRRRDRADLHPHPAHLPGRRVLLGAPAPRLGRGGHPRQPDLLHGECLPLRPARTERRAAVDRLCPDARLRAGAGRARAVAAQAGRRPAQLRPRAREPRHTLAHPRRAPAWRPPSLRYPCPVTFTEQSECAKGLSRSLRSHSRWRRVAARRRRATSPPWPARTRPATPPRGPSMRRCLPAPPPWKRRTPRAAPPPETPRSSTATAIPSRSWPSTRTACRSPPSRSGSCRWCRSRTAMAR